MSLTQLIDRICVLSEEANDWYGAGRPVAGPGRDGRPAPSPHDELHRLLHSLPAATVYTLLVIMLVGRGELRPEDDFLDNYIRASNDFAKPHAAIVYMADLENLAIHLENGLARMDDAGIDVCWELEP